MRYALKHRNIIVLLEYKSILALYNGVIPIIPTDEDITLIGKLIYPNLENGIVVQEDKMKLIELVEKYIVKEKADSLLLGCTELPLAIKETDISVPILDSTEIHINEIFYGALE